MHRDFHVQQGSLNTSSRRGFLKTSGVLAAGTAISAMAIPAVHAAENNTIQLAIVGCGGRGSGAVGNALDSTQGPTKLVAMADVFEPRLKASYENLRKQYGEKIDVPKDRQFVGFDAYKKAIDSLRPGDVAILTTYCGFRPTHLEYAVSKGVHVFFEKNFASDPAGAHQVLRAAKVAKEKNLKIGAGVMCRHSTARQAMIQKIRDGALGQVQLIRTYRMDSGYGVEPFNFQGSQVLWQVARPWATFWVSAGLYLELMIHLIDECCWIKDGYPVEAHGIGGRLGESRDIGQNLDSHSVEYTFADGTKALATGRYVPNCFNHFSTYIHGSKCGAQFSGNIHAPVVHAYKDQRMNKGNIAWKVPVEQVSPYLVEWNELLGAIRNDKPHNEAERAAYSTFAGLMGRAAIHTGQIVTWKQITDSNFAFCPNVASLTADSPAPAQFEKDGRFLPPVPGKWTEF
jgi:predicted dehydrogenase